MLQLNEPIISTEDIQYLHNSIRESTDSNTESIYGIISEFIKRIVNTRLNGETALGIAASHKNDWHELVDFLVQSGAELEAPTDELNSTALAVSNENGNLQVVELLIENGAMLSSRDTENTTPLQCAALNNQVKCLELMIQKGCNIEELGAHNSTAFLYSAFEGMDAMKCLVENGCNVTATDENGCNALHYAASIGNVAAINYLLGLKLIDVNECNLLSDTPLDLACIHNYPEAAIALIKGGANHELINDKEGKPALELFDNEKTTNYVKSKVFGECSVDTSILIVDNAKRKHHDMVFNSKKLKRT